MPTTAELTAPATDAARQWDGWGTALKPAVEEWWLFRKPLGEPTVAANVLEYGTGALNVDGSRVGTEEMSYVSNMSRMQEWSKAQGARLYKDGFKSGDLPKTVQGRWPANLIHDGSEEVLAGFPREAPSGGKLGLKRDHWTANGRNGGAIETPSPRLPDSGSAARFFYCAKASPADREDGNTHPTVKPTELMRYLCRLVTPPGGTVLDPFMGSGSTGLGAYHEGFGFVGIEREAEYIAIARFRITDAQRQLRLPL
jgi:site-specific DNA-methyltransferase (adenine-specific)